jgi:type I restriction enzyme S subunit
MSEWYKVSKLVELGILETPMDGNHGEIHPVSKDFVKKGIPFIMSSDINNGVVDFEKCKFITKKHSLRLRKGFSKYGDVLLTHKASIGRTAINNYQDNDFIMLTPQVTYYRVIDFNRLNNYYLKYYFQSNYFQVVICSWANAGSTRAYIGITKQLDLPIFLPKITTQQKIAAVLSALDDKIELNNQINTELEQMAKTLYDYWFVQFDFPNVKDKPYKSSGGKMVYNEVLKREIPDGWEVKSLYKVANFINGLACQKYRPLNENDPYLPVIKIREMGDGISANTEKVRVDIPEKNKIDDGDVLFSWSATLDVKIWTEGKGALNQHIFKVTSDHYPRSFYYFEVLNYLHHFKMMAELRKTTMGHITIDHLKTSFIAVPPIDLIKELDKKVNIVLSKIIINKKQNQELAALRDWLLPMLMNGQVKVGDDAEQEEAEVLVAAEPQIVYRAKELQPIRTDKKAKGKKQDKA